ncbi:hypothetical protein BKH42_08615 [Helicobacter sp. 13S00482-2]|uniref:hypothetical protein n=1 Tax=Helicobacter sp. 13S00482-2 TaxID=1476200 RepID=UPI000BA5AE06|nr:hypothetical protein [Helicobacter sp. 13S00482-2]PAF52945.1 hypothetical protein BKH42_08615 [Helicobacter sp. 13S00482-2]
MLDKQVIYKILESKLKQANYRWYNEEFLWPEMANDFLGFHIFDTKKDYRRLHKGKSLQKLLYSIFNDSRLDGLNEMVFVGDLVYFKNQQIKRS